MDFRVHLIACGGTAMTLLDIKESTKDIDFIVPNDNQYKRLMRFLIKIGYYEKGGGWIHNDDPLFIYQFWAGKQVFTTELLDSPLDLGKHIPIEKYRHIYLSALNLIDLIITKMFRGTPVDLEDCVNIFLTGAVDVEELLERYSETALYDITPAKVMKNFSVFVDELSSRQLISSGFHERVKSCRREKRI